MGTVLCVGGSEHLHSRSLVLQSAGFDVTVAITEAAALAALSSAAPHAVILDSSSTERPGDLAMEIKRIRPAVPVLLVADTGAEDTVIRPKLINGLVGIRSFRRLRKCLPPPAQGRLPVILIPSSE
jgi:DNA-binding NtrC family response regulator